LPSRDELAKLPRERMRKFFSEAKEHWCKA
jgi:hypothetical protein